MSAVQRGLGRGLDALLQGIDAEDDAPSEKGIVLVPIADIRPNAQQPRRDFEDEALRELADSIRSSGVLQPILVRPLADDTHRFELVAGERRWRASQLADLSEIPAMVRDLDDQESLAIALIENLQREDLNPIEEALGLKRLQEDFGLKQEDLALKVGKSRPAIANTLRLLQLSEEIQLDIRNGSMSAGHGRSMLAIGDEQARVSLHKRCIDQGLSVREAEAQATYWKKTGSLPGEESGQQPRPGKTHGKRDIPAEIMELQDRLADMLGVGVAIKGDLAKGRLVFSYANAAQLDALLKRLDAANNQNFNENISALPQTADIADPDMDDALAKAQDVAAEQEPARQAQDVDDEATVGHMDEPEDDADIMAENESEPDAVDPIEAMLAGNDESDRDDMLADDDGMDLADLLEDDDDDAAADTAAHEEQLEDFDDDELADLDRALDEILDETKKI